MNSARASATNRNAPPLSLVPVQTAERPAELVLWVSELRPALALVAHANRSAFDVGSHIDLDWSPATRSDEAPAWGLTATDGHRLARFTSDRVAWFREPGAFVAPLPGWIVEWMKHAPDTARVTIRASANGCELVLPGHGTFRPESGAFGAWVHLLADLRNRKERGERSFSLVTSAAPSLLKSIELGKHEHPGVSVFLQSAPDDTWGVTFEDSQRAVGLDPSYLFDALKALARVAKAERGPLITARWADTLDPVAFTVPHLLTVIMPRR